MSVLPIFLVALAASPLVYLRLSSLAKERRADAVRAQYRARKAQLVHRFGEDAAFRIEGGDPWQGATEDMIRAMLGEPAHVAQTVLKTKTKETWAYGQAGKNRYFAKVFFENGKVVGWSHK